MSDNVIAALFLAPLTWLLVFAFFAWIIYHVGRNLILCWWEQKRLTAMIEKQATKASDGAPLTHAGK